MAQFTAALFATTQHPHKQDQFFLEAHAFLFEGSMPYWDIHVKDKRFRFVPHLRFVAEDALWFIHEWVTSSEFQRKIEAVSADFIEPALHLDKYECMYNRSELEQKLSSDFFQFKFITWPDAQIPDLKKNVRMWNESGINVSLAAG